MSFGTTKPRSDYTGTGGTATYAFGFRIFAYTDLLVQMQTTAGVITTLVYNVDFTVTGGLNNPNGGTITLTAGNLANGYKLTIRFYRTTQQTTALRNQGGFFLNVHEDKFDEIVRMIQQNEDQLNRSVSLPGTELGVAGGIALPAASLRALQFLGFDASGNPIVGAPTNAVVSAAMVPVLSAATLAAAMTVLGCLPLAGGNMTGGINEAQTTVASASSPDIWTGTGNLINYTGAITTTGFANAPQAGASRVLICASTPTFNNGANLIMPNGANYTASAGDWILVYAVSTTQFRVMIFKVNGQAVVVPATVLRSYLAGLGLSTAGASTTMTVAAGVAMDSGNVDLMTLAASIGKTTGAWVVGTGNGGLDTGAIANSTWYHFYLIKRTDTGVVDVLISLSASAPTMPANYTEKRRIGSGKTDGGGNWTAFTQDGEYFRWAASVLDVNTTNPGTAAVSATLTVPTGVNVQALMNISLADSAGVTNWLNVSDLAANDELGSATAAPLGVQGIYNAQPVQSADRIVERTNTSAQIRYRVSASSATVIVRIATLGWIDKRGRDA